MSRGKKKKKKKETSIGNSFIFKQINKFTDPNGKNYKQWTDRDGNRHSAQTEAGRMTANFGSFLRKKINRKKKNASATTKKKKKVKLKF